MRFKKYYVAAVILATAGGAHAAPECPVTRDDIPVGLGKCAPVDGAVIKEKTAICANGLYSVEGNYRTYVGGAKKPHLGVDLRAPKGTDVYAVSQSTLFLIIRKKSGAGTQVNLMHPDGTVGRYFHLDTVSLDEEDADGTVIAGQKIGTVGNTGFQNTRYKDCFHLHFQVQTGGYPQDSPRTFTERTVDPMDWLESNDDTYVVNTSPSSETLDTDQTISVRSGDE